MIQYKSKLPPLSEGVKQRNEAFHALSDEDKRREIALDVISLIDSGIIRERQDYSSYWSEYLIAIKNSSETSAEFQERLLNLDIPPCHVCARGAMMLSTIRLGNRVSPHGYDIPMGAPTNIQGFTIQEFEQMERCYEWITTLNKLFYEERFEDVVRYSKNVSQHYKFHSSKLIKNMMLNVLNNGRFDTNDHTLYVEPDFVTGKPEEQN